MIQDNMLAMAVTHLESKIYADSGSVVLSEEVMHVSGKMGIVIENEKLTKMIAKCVTDMSVLGKV